MVFVAGNTGDTDSDGNDDDYEDGSDDGAVDMSDGSDDGAVEMSDGSDDGSDDGAVAMSVATAISGIDREPCYSRITLLRDLHSCYT